MPTTSRLSLRQQVASVLHGSDTFLTGTVASGSASTAVVTALISTMAGANQFVGYWLYIDAAADAAPEGEARMVKEYNPVNGTLTVDPDFTAAPAASDTFELHPVLHPDRINEAINWALEFGANEAYAAITDDDLTSSPIYDRDILVQGRSEE